MKAVIRYFSAAVLAAALCVGMGFLYHHVRQVASGSVCSRLEISFADSLRFVREQDIREYLDSRYGPCIGERLDSIRLASIEDMLESRSAVMRAEAWTTRDGTLHIDITQRAPYCGSRETKAVSTWTSTATSSRCTRPTQPPFP